MKFLSITFVTIVLLVSGIGFYRGWFAVSRPAPVAGSHIVSINLATDPGKIRHDAEAIRDKATELTGGATEGVKADGQASDNVKSNAD